MGDKRFSDTKLCGWGVLAMQMLALAVAAAADAAPPLHQALFSTEAEIQAEELSGTVAPLPALGSSICGG